MLNKMRKKDNTPIENTKYGHKEGFDLRTSPKGFYSIKERLTAKESNCSK